MLRAKERGEGKLGTIFGLALLAGAIFAGFHVIPVFWDHYNLVDKMNELARAPKWSHPDDKIYEMLIKYVREERLDPYVQKANFTVSTVETNRRIAVSYHRQTEILPGWKHDFTFSKQIDQPLVY